MLGDAKTNENMAMAEGTLAHEIAEQKLRGAYEEVKSSTVKSRITKAKKNAVWEGEPLYKGEMEECTDEYVSYIGGIYNQLRNPKIWIEKRVSMTPLSPDMFGTCDCAILSEEVLHVIDYKHGRGVAVDVTDNPQAKLYAYGVLCDPSVRMLYNPQRIVLHIVQPRNGGTNSWDLPTDQLLSWIDRRSSPLWTVSFPADWPTNGTPESIADFVPIWAAVRRPTTKAPGKTPESLRNTRTPPC